MTQQPQSQSRSNQTDNFSNPFSTPLYHGAFSSLKPQPGLPFINSQEQVTQQNQQSNQISVHLADVASRAARRADRSPGNSA